MIGPRCDADLFAATGDRPVSPGAVAFRRDGEGAIEAVCLGCPGCGRELMLGIDPEFGWSITSVPADSVETLSMSPWVTHSYDDGGCGWRGKIAGGKASSL